MRPLFFRWALVAWIVASPLLTVHAQLPLTRLTSISPLGATPGSTFPLTISGTDLDGPTTLWFSDSRIVARPLPDVSDRFEIHVPPEVPQGVVDVRITGRFGISNPRAFAITPYPVSTATQSHDSPKDALEISLGTAVSGSVHPAAAKWFRFHAAAGTAVVARIGTRSMDSQLVPDLAFTDESGRELAIARRRDWLTFNAPSNGHYLLRLNDQSYRGGESFHFLLTLDTGPHIEFTLPNVLQTGTTNVVTLYGRNLPDAKPGNIRGVDGHTLDEVAVVIMAPKTPSPRDDVIGQLPIPASVTLIDTSFVWRWNSSVGGSNPVQFILTTNPVTDTRINPLPHVAVPADVSGVFPSAGTVSGITFNAEKGDALWIEVDSHRLGYPTRPHVLVQRSLSPAPASEASSEVSWQDVVELSNNEPNFGDREFNTITQDPAGRFEVPETGTYRVLVRDRFNLGTHRPRYPFRLAIRHPQPDVQLVAFPQPPTRVGEDRSVQLLPVSLRRTETVPLKLLAFRRDGFDGPIELSADFDADADGSGVTIAPSRIDPGTRTGTLLITASSLAQGNTSFTIKGQFDTPAGSVSRTAVMTSVARHVQDFNNENAIPRMHRTPIFGIIADEFSPVSIAVTPPDQQALHGHQGGVVQVPLAIKRTPGFTAAFTLKPAGHSTLDKAEPITVPEGEGETNVVATIQIPEFGGSTNTTTLWFHGSVGGKYRNNPDAVPLAESEVQAAIAALESVSEGERSAAEARKAAAEIALKAATERATPKDVNFRIFSAPFTLTVTPPPPPPPTPSSAPEADSDAIVPANP